MGAQRTLAGACRLWPHTVVAVKVVLKNDLLAFWMVLITIGILALLQQVFVKLLCLDDLLTLPAGCQHRAFLPVMDVDGLVVERWVVPVAESAHILRIGLISVVPVLLFVRLLVLRSL